MKTEDEVLAEWSKTISDPFSGPELSFSTANGGVADTLNTPFVESDFLQRSFGSEFLRLKNEDDCDDTSNPCSEPSSPGLNAPEHTLFGGSDILSVDANTQMSLINRSEALRLSEHLGEQPIKSAILWDSVVEDEETNLPEDPGGARKVLKLKKTSDAPSSGCKGVEEEQCFDAEGATSSTHFTFAKFGKDLFPPEDGLARATARYVSCCKNYRIMHM